MDTKLKLSYLAGILDGEGCFNIYKGGKRPRVDYGARLYVVSTDLVLVEWLKKHFDGYTYTRLTRDGWKTKYEWIIEKDRAVSISQQVMPYLVIKQPQANLLIRFRKTFTINRRLSDEIKDEREFCYSKMKELNHRNTNF